MLITVTSDMFIDRRRTPRMNGGLLCRDRVTPDLETSVSFYACYNNIDGAQTVSSSLMQTVRHNDPTSFSLTY